MRLHDGLGAAIGKAGIAGTLLLLIAGCATAEPPQPACFATCGEPLPEPPPEPLPQ